MTGVEVVRGVVRAEAKDIEDRLANALEEYREELLKPLEAAYEAANAKMEKLVGVRGAHARLCEARGTRDGIRSAIDLIKAQ